MRGDYEGEKEFVALLCGTPQDLSGLLTAGTIFRVCPMIIFHDSEEHSKIGQYINSNIGIEENNSRDEEANIKNFYEELLKIQTDSSKELNPIKGYIISENIKKKIYNKWNIITKKASEDTRLNFFRELHEGYRFLISHAFLNVFERKIEESKLIPNEKDLEVATYFMTQNIILKRKLLRFEGFARNLKSIRELDAILKDQNINQEDKKIIRSLVKK